MRRKLIIVVLALVFLTLGVAIVLWPEPSSKQVLPDGTVLILSGLKVQSTNVYSHGTALAKILGGLVPSNGVSVGSFKLRPVQTIGMRAYDGGEALAAEIKLLPGSPREQRLISPPFYRNCRLRISGDNDYTFIQDFNDFKNYGDGVFSQLWADNFPRDSHLLRFRVEERDSSETRDWRELATFILKNPKPARLEPWKAESAPRFKVAGEVDVEVGQLVVRHQPIHPTDIWEHTAELPMRITRQGQTVTNWGILEGKIRDASGNRVGMPSIKAVTNDWTIYRHYRPPDPTKLWWFHLQLGLDSDFPETNLFSFTVPWPMTGTLQTNLGGFPCTVGLVNRRMLSVEITNQPPNMRLSFVRAVDDDGSSVDDRAGSWGQHRFWRGLNVSKPVQVHVTVAIRPEYEIEFTLQPRYEKKPGADRERTTFP